MCSCIWTSVSDSIWKITMYYLTPREGQWTLCIDDKCIKRMEELMFGQTLVWKNFNVMDFTQWKIIDHQACQQITLEYQRIYTSKEWCHNDVKNDEVEVIGGRHASLGFGVLGLIARKIWVTCGTHQ